MENAFAEQIQSQLKNHHITIQQLNDKIDLLANKLGIEEKAFNKEFAEKIKRIYELQTEVYTEEYNMEETK